MRRIMNWVNHRNNLRMTYKQHEEQYEPTLAEQQMIQLLNEPKEDQPNEIRILLGQIDAKEKMIDYFENKQGPSGKDYDVAAEKKQLVQMEDRLEELLNEKRQN